MIKSLGHKFLEDFVGDLADIEVTLDLTTTYNFSINNDNLSRII